MWWTGHATWAVPRGAHFVARHSAASWVKEHVPASVVGVHLLIHVTNNPTYRGCDPRGGVGGRRLVAWRNMAGSRASGRRKSTQSVLDAYCAVQTLFRDHESVVDALHADLMEHAMQALSAERTYTEEERQRVLEFLDDRIMIFRFLRRAGFDKDTARSMLIKTVAWRMEGAIDALPQDLLQSPYMNATSNGIPLFWQHSRFRDKLGRPALYVRLQHVERTPEGLHELKKTIIASFDVMRRYLLRVNRRTRRGDPVIQCVVLVDVMDAGLANVELDILPFFTDLLKNHYPSLCGAVYILRYSWFHAGLWRMLRPILPPKLLERLFFVDRPELLAHFEHHMPRPLGGPLSIPIAPDTSDVFNYFVRAAAWSHPSSSSSGPTPKATDPSPPALRIRQHDFDTIYDVMSCMGSPYTPARTPLTPHTSMPTTPRQHAQTGSPIPLHDLPTSPKAYRRQRASGDARSVVSWFLSWLSPPQRSDDDEAPAEPIRTSRGGDADAAPVPTPPATATAPPTAYGTAESNTVTRYLSWRAHKYAEMDGHVSPYNIENPYFGYPASYVTHDPASVDMTASDPAAAAAVAASGGARPAGFSREIHVKRRKRDLVRTLSYLFVLRLIRLYHTIRRGILVVVWNVLGPHRAWASLGRTSPGHRPSRYTQCRVLVLLALLLYLQLPRARFLSLLIPHFHAIV